MAAMLPEIPDALGLFALTASAIVLEAAPFLLFGSILAALIDAFVPAETVCRLFPKKPLPGVLVGIGLGFVFPICECGIVPVIRRLTQKGVPPGPAVAFMLAAPVVNPVVALSTLTAFQGDPTMMFCRVGLAVLVAGVVGLALSGLEAREALLPGGFPTECARGCGQAHGHGGHEGLTPLDLAMKRPLGARLAGAWGHAVEEFLSMGALLVLGALIAATFKTLVPYQALLALENDVFLAVTAMMLLAVLLSLCSEADAFVAASFVSLPFASKLAFLTLGPMVDVKLAIMFQAVFTRRVVLVLLLLPTVEVFILSILAGWLFP